MKKLNNAHILSILLLIIGLISSCNDSENEKYIKIPSSVPNLKMPENNLSFKEIEDYKNYKIVATHFRTDKNELRYILANKKAFKAFKNKTEFPEGSKIVKIGWSIKEMPEFSPALVQDSIRRIEYMIKRNDFDKKQGNWGYARFVNEKGTYKSWDEGTQSCVSCHDIAKKTGYVFSEWALNQ